MKLLALRIFYKDRKNMNLNRKNTCYKIFFNVTTGNSQGFVAAVSRAMKPALNGTDYTSGNTMELSKSFEKEQQEDLESSFFLE